MSIKRPRLLTGRKSREEKYSLVKGRGGCYDCSLLRGTMLNTYTNKIIAICTEQILQYAPHPKDGCHLSKPFSSKPFDSKSRKRRLRKKSNNPPPNPNGYDRSTNISDKLLKRAEDAIGNRISLSPRMLAKKMGLDQNSANNTLCGHILRRLKWKKLNPNNSRGAWVKGDVELE